MLSELIEEIEERFRIIVREEIRQALLESGNSTGIESYSVKAKDKETKNIPTILTAPEVAEILNIKIQRVYELVRMRKKNGMPVITLGERQYRFSRDAIWEWMNRENQ
jgi:excisionase family DNA binding protein